MGSGTLVGKAVNQTVIPFIDWVEVRFQLGENSTAWLELKVLMVVSAEDNIAEEPIIGYNVIEVLLKKGPGQPPQTTIQAVSAAFSINSKSAKKLTKLIQTSDP